MSRSPYQRKKPVTANRSANTAVTIAFSFWPAFSRPWGARRPRSQARSSRRRVDLAQRPPQAAAVAGDHDGDEGDRPGDRRVDVDRLQQRPAADQLGEARQVEAEAACRAGRRNAPACTQCTARSVRVKRGRRGAVCSRSHSSARPTRSGRSRGLPSSRSAASATSSIRVEPLHALVAVHLGDHDPRRRAVRPRQRLAVELEASITSGRRAWSSVSESSYGSSSETKRIAFAAGQRLGEVEQMRGSERPPSGRPSRSSR